ncbi:MAG: MBL fold metallo-hydrolase, partial [Chloroflexi bacterium]|nr:MBL fold metallo-hydrolase [Chloroflexota bacterium]
QHNSANHETIGMIMTSPFKVWEDIYMIGSPDISHHMDCCIYLVDAGELVMIDAGAGKSTNQLIDNILSLELMPEKLTTLVITHAHIDHIGSLAELKRSYQVNVIAHELDTNAIETGQGVGAEYYGVNYRPDIVDIKLSQAESILEIGSHTFKFLHIPGHTPGSIVVVVEIAGKKILFGQDIHGPYHHMWGGEPAKAKESLEKLITIKADILCEGHYGIIKPSKAVEEFIIGYFDDLTAR